MEFTFFILLFSFSGYLFDLCRICISIINEHRAKKLSLFGKNLCGCTYGTRKTSVVRIQVKVIKTIRRKPICCLVQYYRAKEFPNVGNRAQMQSMVAYLLKCREESLTVIS